ncbi:hypothetical protein SAMN05660748_1259 [Blastococcus aggregatus]|uniref:Uncharacterized protein n=1 Tax=Blastococcus aggregatus TaxID=38502 RepID=A0A285V7S4_9ACTN|nr:DUF6158 family protein [Blastococcus aggregatus]SOC48561.1 hypothetical protein SAMN05660748_1259 [Blastococcus aggregatus]
MTGTTEGSAGVPARELSDEELERQGTYTHATRTWVLLHGTAEQFRHHTERMLELEQEYLRRHPKRTWQGIARTDDVAGLDPLSRLRLELRGVMRQIDALLSDPTLPGASGTRDRAVGVPELLRRFAAAEDGRLHKLEAHQLAREVGVPPLELAELYKADPPLLRAEGDYRVLTHEGQRRLERPGA